MITTLLLLCSIIFLNFMHLSINVLVLSIILCLVVYRYKRQARYDYMVYIGLIALVVLSFFVEIQIISSGLLGFSMFNVVMFTGVLPNQWEMTKKLKTYRGFFSILGFISMIPHVVIHLFMDQQINIFGIASIVLMLPLFITSFNVVKKAMKLEEWLKLQKISYLVYVLLFIHLVSVSDWFGKVVYMVMMTLYINNKLMKELKR